MGQTSRDGGQTSASSQHPQLRRTVHEGPTQPLHVRVPGDFVFLEFGLANEQNGNVISVDTVNQTFTAIVTGNHPAGSSIRPSIWPTAVLLEGNDLAFGVEKVLV